MILSIQPSVITVEKQSSWYVECVEIDVDANALNECVNKNQLPETLFGSIAAKLDEIKGEA